jgi:hypothetical protein
VKFESCCGQCEGVVEHAAWCATREPRVAYAYLIVKDASKITVGDSLILHSLGVAWVESSDDLVYVNTSLSPI